MTWFLLTDLQPENSSHPYSKIRMRYVVASSIRILIWVKYSTSQSHSNIAIVLPQISFIWLGQLRLSLKINNIMYNLNMWKLCRIVYVAYYQSFRFLRIEAKAINRSPLNHIMQITIDFRYIICNIGRQATNVQLNMICVHFYIAELQLSWQIIGINII